MLFAYGKSVSSVLSTASPPGQPVQRADPSPLHQYLHARSPRWGKAFSRLRPAQPVPLSCSAYRRMGLKGSLGGCCTVPVRYAVVRNYVVCTLRRMHLRMDKAEKVMCIKSRIPWRAWQLTKEGDEGHEQVERQERGNNGRRREKQEIESRSVYQIRKEQTTNAKEIPARKGRGKEKKRKHVEKGKTPSRKRQLAPYKWGFAKTFPEEAGSTGAAGLCASWKKCRLEEVGLFGDLVISIIVLGQASFLNLPPKEKGCW